MDRATTKGTAAPLVITEKMLAAAASMAEQPLLETKFSTEYYVCTCEGKEGKLLRPACGTKADARAKLDEVRSEHPSAFVWAFKRVC